jgi:membrane-associated protease RseP (regulator of RpoE activity)
MPAMYEVPTIRPVLHGAVKNSPAARAGLRFGDLVLAVDGSPVFTRAELMGLLATRYDDLGIERTTFSIQRQDRLLDVTVPMVRDRVALEYPFREFTHTPSKRLASTLGLHMADGLPLRSLVALEEIAAEYADKKVLFYVSPLAATAFSEGLSMLGDVACEMRAPDFHVDVLWPRYWGGNVVVGDLWTFQDLIDHTRDWISHHRMRPDVVVAPETFMSPSRHDLAGACHVDFERALDIEFRALPCPRIGI